MLRIKRIYDEPAGDDGYRVLIDRLWPRGLSKEKAAIDLWLKEIAPSEGLRTWFDHKPERFEEFSHKYMDELATNLIAVKTLEKLLDENKSLTLLYGAKNPVVNQAVVLKEFLEKRKQA